MVHELAANLQGVRCEYTSVVEYKMQKEALVRYCRGHIEVLDREALEQTCCDCYAVSKSECRRLPPTTADAFSCLKTVCRTCSRVQIGLRLDLRKLTVGAVASVS
jgi:hypothetical protein